MEEAFNQQCWHLLLGKGKSDPYVDLQLPNKPSTRSHPWIPVSPWRRHDPWVFLDEDTREFKPLALKCPSPTCLLGKYPLVFPDSTHVSPPWWNFLVHSSLHPVSSSTDCNGWCRFDYDLSLLFDCLLRASTGSLSSCPAVLAEGLVGTKCSTNIDKDLKLLWIILVLWVLYATPSVPCLTLTGNLEKK